MWNLGLRGNLGRDLGLGSDIGLGSGLSLGSGLDVTLANDFAIVTLVLTLDIPGSPHPLKACLSTDVRGEW